MLAIVTVGIPACGKSTFARGLVADGWFDLNRDALRATVGGGFGVPRAEAAVTRLWRNALRDAASAGKDIILSDTHVSRRSRKEVCRTLRRQGYERITALVFDVPLDTCLQRNRARAVPVPDEVLYRMADTLRRQPVWLTDGFTAIDVP
ncbi:MAG: AAA family ATPase [Candidatus Sericytochromatia bacterium]|uniref:AAA family ATPase n=1 Tax=Candidatus Tanganyikabacteria bacterium TaxID=2961651 RepID=A0A937X109_9BACT|nr:AAA family ATPase [Candidatus Tanganyikabacteria bacterium]